MQNTGSAINILNILNFKYMTQSTFVSAKDLQVSLEFLNGIKLELQTAATQVAIFLVKRKLPEAPPAALTDALAAVESFLVAQAVTAIQDQINSQDANFAAL